MNGHAAMQIRIIPARELSVELVRAWTVLQRANAYLDSPFFSPQFTQLIGQTRNNVHIAVIEDDGKIVGFFPYQAEWGGQAIPVGSFMNEFNGLIGASDLALEPREFLRKAGMECLTFELMLAQQSAFAPCTTSKHDSPCIFLPDGYEAYRIQNRERGSTLFPQTESRIRRLEREVGPIRFEEHTTDAGMLKTLFQWKSSQYRATGRPDLFATEDSWPSQVVRRCLEATGPEMAGIFSVLYAGDRFIAGHVGLRSAAVWNNWYPAYDHEFDRYSPGSILMLEMIRRSTEIGVSRFDLGWGPAVYKDRLRNGNIELSKGTVRTFSLKWSLHRAAGSLRDKVKSFLPRSAATAESKS